MKPGSHEASFLIRHYVQGDRYQSRKTKLMRGRRRKIDNSAFVERSAIIDSHGHVLAVVEVVNSNPRTKRQGAVGGGHVVHVIDFAARGWPPMIGMTVPGSDPLGRQTLPMPVQTAD